MGYYKYTKPEWIQSSIDYGAYASRIDAVNDPYEMEGIVHPEDFRICCLASSSMRMLMWSYYTKHQGCCIEYEFEKGIIEAGILKPVEYVRDYYERRYMSNEEIRRFLYLKGKEWKKEKEVRAVWYKDDTSQHWIINGENVYLKAKVKSITFGLLAERDEEEYLKALKCIQEYNLQRNKNAEIIVKKLILSNKKYRLQLDQQFDYTREIDRIENGRQ